MPADVHDIERQMAIVEREKVQKVAREFVTRNVPPRDRHVLDRSVAGGKE